MKATDARPTVIAMQSIAELLRERTGLTFSDARWPSLEQGVFDTMKALREINATRLLDRLQGDGALLDALVSRITVGETYFYRDTGQLDVMRGELLPRLRALRPPGHRLRLWSAGCATGEEAYTLAMLTSEMGIAPAPYLLGTDISRPALDRAMRARYSEWALRALSPEQIARYFRLVGGEWVLSPTIASAVTFAQLNLAAADYPSMAANAWGMDLILCRNVLIYFDQEQAQRAIARLLDALSDDGYLVLGVADPLPLSSLTGEPEITSAGVILRRVPRGAVRSVAGSGFADETRVSRACEPRSPVLGAAAPFRDTSVGSVRQARATPSVVAAPVPAPQPDHAALAAAELEGKLKMAYETADYATAQHLARHLLQRGPHERAAVLLVRSLANRGLLDEAARWCDAELARHQTSAELYALQAMLLLEARHPHEAARAARAALYLDRSLIVAHLLLGRALLGLRELRRARHAFRHASRLLEAHPVDVAVTAADGEHVETLMRVVREHLSLLDEAA